MVSEHADAIFQLVEESALIHLNPSTILSIRSGDEIERNKKAYEKMVWPFSNLFPYIFTLKNPAFAEE